MPDDRSSGGLGNSGYIRFSGIDNSGRVPDLLNQKRSKDPHEQPEKEKNEEKKDGINSSEFVDRSAQLNATLNSLAMLNVANVMKNNSNKISIPPNKKTETEKNPG